MYTEKKKKKYMGFGLGRGVDVTDSNFKFDLRKKIRSINLAPHLNIFVESVYSRDTMNSTVCSINSFVADIKSDLNGLMGSCLTLSGALRFGMESVSSFEAAGNWYNT